MAYGKCILCSDDREGQLVSDSHVIKFIRAVKQRLNMAANNTLVVCAGCMELYTQKRKKFERKWALNAVLAIGVVFLLVVLPVLTGAQFSITSLLLAPLLAFFIALLALTDYMPPLVSQGAMAQPQPIPYIANTTASPSAQAFQTTAQATHAAPARKAHASASAKKKHVQTARKKGNKR